MKNKMENLFNKAAGLGAVTGMRTTVALGLASHYLSKKPKKALEKSRLGFMQSPKAAIITKVLGFAELAADKNPKGPNRISLPQVLARLSSGGLVGAVLFQSKKEDALQGFLIGASAALASTFISFYLRQLLDTLPYVKDPMVGALEDVIALRSGKALMES